MDLLTKRYNTLKIFFEKEYKGKGTKEEISALASCMSLKITYGVMYPQHIEEQLSILNEQAN